MKHAIILHKMDREDCWIMSPIIIPLDKKYTTFIEASDHVKTYLEARPEIIDYITTRHCVKDAAINEYENDYNMKDVKITFKDITRGNKLSINYTLSDDSGEFAEYSLILNMEFTVIFE